MFTVSFLSWGDFGWRVGVVVRFPTDPGTRCRFGSLPRTGTTGRQDVSGRVDILDTPGGTVGRDYDGTVRESSVSLKRWDGRGRSL